MNNFLVSLSALAVEYKPGWQWVGEIVNFLNTILPYLLIVVLTAGAIYAVVLGVNMARAEDAGKREEAKKRIINFIIALAVTVLLIIILRVFVANANTWFGIEI